MKFRQIVAILAILTMVAICVQPVAAEITDEATIYYNNAQQLISNGEYERALEMLDKVLASNTTLLGMGDGLMYTYKDRSGLLTDLGRYEEAVAAADQGITLYRNNSGLWNNKGYAYYKMGKYSEAVDAYDNAIRIDPTYLKGWINKGNALVKAGRGKEAQEAYRKALELDPGNADATAGLEEAKKIPGSPGFTIVAVIAIGLVAMYCGFRKRDSENPAERNAGKR